jgi:hypothetical protein
MTAWRGGVSSAFAAKRESARTSSWLLVWTDKSECVELGSRGRAETVPFRVMTSSAVELGSDFRFVAEEASAAALGSLPPWTEAVAQTKPLVRI